MTQKDNEVLMGIAEKVGITRTQAKQCILYAHYIGYTRHLPKLKMRKGYRWDKDGYIERIPK